LARSIASAQSPTTPQRRPRRAKGGGGFSSTYFLKLCGRLSRLPSRHARHPSRGLDLIGLALGFGALVARRPSDALFDVAFT
jgi:hypothetical protein